MYCVCDAFVIAKSGFWGWSRQTPLKMKAQLFDFVVGLHFSVFGSTVENIFVFKLSSVFWYWKSIAYFIESAFYKLEMHYWKRSTGIYLSHIPNPKASPMNLNKHCIFLNMENDLTLILRLINYFGWSTFAMKIV